MLHTDRSTPISNFLRARVGRDDVPAIVAAVVNRDALLYLDAFGKRDVGRSLDARADAIFRIASMTKPVTSLAVMMLYDDGRIALDDAIVNRLPHYEQPRVLTNAHGSTASYDSRPAARPITVHDLLTHTSGMAYSFLDPVLTRLSAAGKSELELPLLHDPGKRWTYGPSTALLGQLVAHLSAETLDDFCRKRIFEPLGMRDTAYAVPTDKRERVVTLHQREAGGTLAEKVNPPTIQSRGRGDDGLFSTAGDYAAFLQLFLNGGRCGAARLVSEAAIRLMMTNQIGDLVIERQSAVSSFVAMAFPPGAGKDKFGFGFQIETPPSEPGLRALESVSWGGIFNTHFWIDPQNDIAAVVMMQTLPYADEKCSALVRGFERLVYQQFG
jgi:methyl acetate hydrolase